MGKKDMRIKKSEFVAKTQFLLVTIFFKCTSDRMSLANKFTLINSEIITSVNTSVSLKSILIEIQRIRNSYV